MQNIGKVFGNPFRFQDVALRAALQKIVVQQLRNQKLVSASRPNRIDSPDRHRLGVGGERCLAHGGVVGKSNETPIFVVYHYFGQICRSSQARRFDCRVGAPVRECSHRAIDAGKHQTTEQGCHTNHDQHDHAAPVLVAVGRSFDE